MKKILIFLLLVSSTFANENLMLRIDSIVDVISQSRTTVTKAQVNRLKDPFVKQRVQTSDWKTEVVALTQPSTPSYEKVHFTLHAIVNERAKINNRWIAKGDTINEFVLQDLGTNFAKLNYQNFYTRVLYLNKANDNLIKGRSNEN